MSKNLDLWESVSTTDPAFTKGFSRSGGFKGTAISPMYLFWKATQKFGPIGIGWGFSEVENKFIEGVWCSKVRLWYKLDGVRGEAEQWGQTTMVGNNKNGTFVDEEAPKKAVTDAATKCLSYIGFAADVHMGRYDDNKYVAELNQKKRRGEIDNDDAPEDCKPDPEKHEAIRAQKLAEAAAAGSKYAPAAQIDSNDIPVQLGGTFKAEPPKVDRVAEMRERAVKPQTPQKAPSFEQMMAVFAQLKADFVALGAEHDYYAILGEKGFSHANEAVKAGVAMARETKTDMQLRIQLLKSTQPSKGAA